MQNRNLATGIFLSFRRGAYTADCVVLLFIPCFPVFSLSNIFLFLTSSNFSNFKNEKSDFLPVFLNPFLSFLHPSHTISMCCGRKQKHEEIQEREKGEKRGEKAKNGVETPTFRTPLIRTLNKLTLLRSSDKIGYCCKPGAYY